MHSSTTCSTCTKFSTPFQGACRLLYLVLRSTTAALNLLVDLLDRTTAVVHACVHGASRSTAAVQVLSDMYFEY